MAVKFAIRDYSRSGDDVTFTLVALNADGTVDTGFTGAFTWGLNGMTDPGTPTFTAGDQGQLVFTTTITNPAVRTGLAANFPGNASGANLSVSGPSGTNVSFGNQGDHLFVGGAGNDTVNGNIGNDLYLFAQSGSDAANGGGGDDIIYFGGAYSSADTANGGAGTDRLVLQGDYSAGIMLGSLLALESVELLAGDDTIYDGETGTNLLYNIVADAGTAVSDNRLTVDASGLRAGESLVFDGTASAIDFTVSGGAGDDTLSAGAGNDTVSYAGAASGVTVSLAVAGAQNTGGAGNDTLSGFENLTGSNSADILTGDASGNILDGIGGADTMAGGDGDDTYHVDEAGDVVVEVAGEGTDRLFAGASYALQAGAEVELITTDFHAGTAAIDLTGNEFANTILGNDGNNFLNGGAGADTLVGRLGNDWYFVDNAADRIVEGAGEGTDRLFAGTSFTLNAGVEIELLTTDYHAGTAAIDLTGNELANLILGNDGDNVLNGAAGADTLVGRLGDDWYFVDNTADRIAEGVGEGTDRLFATASYTLNDGAEVELITTDFHAGVVAINLTGNEFANTILGNDGNNILNGGAGADTLVGRLGDDWYVVDNAGDRVVEAAGGGNDRVFASASYTLTSGAEVEILTTTVHAGTAAIDLTGNELANIIHGNDGDNVLDGKGGSDILVGRAGGDSFAFTTALGATNVDRVDGFVSGSDRIALDDAIFAGIGTPGAFSAGAFVTGAAAADADDRIVYNSATGQLFYDADGNGAGAAVLFATLQGAPALLASDFAVI